MYIIFVVVFLLLSSLGQPRTSLKFREYLSSFFWTFTKATKICRKIWIFVNAIPLSIVIILSVHLMINPVLCLFLTQDVKILILSHFAFNMLTHFSLKQSSTEYAFVILIIYDTQHTKTLRFTQVLHACTSLFASLHLLQKTKGSIAFSRRVPISRSRWCLLQKPNISIVTIIYSNLHTKCL